MSDKITIQICRFDIPSKSAGKLINKDSVKKVIYSDRFKQNLKKGRVLSLLSHADRYAIENKNIPYEDQVLISEYLAGYGKRAWIDESKNAFFGEIELANNKNGQQIKDMLKKGFDISTSMSVSATADDKYYYVDDILSLGDFTTRPDLEAKVIKIDFSEKRLPNGSNLVTFSQKIPNKNIICNFDDTDTSYMHCTDTYGNTPESFEDGCPVCEQSYNECSCFKDGVYSESPMNSPRPKIIDNPQVNSFRSTTPVDPNMVGAQSVLTNLDGTSGVAGVSVSPILYSSIGSNGLDLTVTDEQVYTDIPIEDRMSRQELIEAPNHRSTVVSNSIIGNFSLRQLITEWKLKPDIVLRQRINEVIQECRARPQEWIDLNNDHLKAYFDSYMLTWVNSAISSDKEFNIGMGLRLALFGVQMKDMIRLNQTIKRMKRNMDQTGFMNKQIQQDLNSAYQSIEDQLYQYIDKKVKQSCKDKSFIIVAGEQDGKQKK